MDVRSTPWRSTHSQRLKPGGPGAVARGLLQGRAQLLVAILLPVPENYGRRLFAFTFLFHVNAKLIVLLAESARQFCCRQSRLRATGRLGMDRNKSRPDDLSCSVAMGEHTAG